MRNLIRPTLFAAARLGLFLAITAWIVGQWWIFELGHTNYWMASGPGGIVVVRTNLSPPAWYRYTALDSSNDLRAKYLAEGYPEVFGRFPKVEEIVDWDHIVAMPYHDSTDWSCCGVRIRRWRLGASFSIRHSTIVSVFILVHIVLTIICRMSQDDQSVES